MNHTDDNEIEAMLRKQFEGPISDEGFSDRVMRQLPLRRRRAAWPLPAGIVVGIFACWLSLSTTPLLRAGWQGWVHGELSAPAIALMAVIAGMALLACWWTTMEADDH